MGVMTRRIHVIGIGAGDPDYVTAQAVAALNDTQVFFAMDKGEAKDDLVALRREVCERFIREPGEPGANEKPAHGVILPRVPGPQGRNRYVSMIQP